MALTKVGKEGITGISNSSDATAITIDSSEKVGIGETTPLGTLHVRTSDASLSSVNANADDLILENNGNCGMSICSSTSGEGNINFIDSGDTNIGRIQYTHSDNNMIFRCNDVERARFQGDGDFLINTTSQLSDGKVSIAATLTTRTCATMKNNSTQGAGHTFIRFTNNSDAIAGSIQHTGTTTTNYGTSSDYRLKENVADMTGAIARVKALAPKRFNFIADADTTVDGFLAHEAQTVVPEAVMGTHNEVDDDNNPIMQQIDHSKLVPVLTAALKEAVAKIEALEARVKTLEDA